MSNWLSISHEQEVELSNGLSYEYHVLFGIIIICLAIILIFMQANTLIAAYVIMFHMGVADILQLIFHIYSGVVMISNSLLGYIIDKDNWYQNTLSASTSLWIAPRFQMIYAEFQLQMRIQHRTALIADQQPETLSGIFFHRSSIRSSIGPRSYGMALWCRAYGLGVEAQDRVRSVSRTVSISASSLLLNSSGG
uniref:7TM_GPCR_Srx domain-containing protein n=1 Tax=Heterorhabditis bacteriophora TaxID=37862 RepID=A0A1I7WHD9_HETBA